MMSTRLPDTFRMENRSHDRDESIIDQPIAIKADNRGSMRFLQALQPIDFITENGLSSGNFFVYQASLEIRQNWRISQRDPGRREHVTQCFETRFFRFDRPFDGSFGHVT